MVADADPDRARAAADRVGASTIDVADVIGAPCDIYAPCAIGGVLNASTIPELACRVVAGAANNQLAGPGDDERLAEAGHPLRARLRDQRGRGDPPGRLRDARMG